MFGYILFYSHMFTGQGLFSLARARHSKSTINLARDQEILSKDFNRVSGDGCICFSTCFCFVHFLDATKFVKETGNSNYANVKF